MNKVNSGIYQITFSGCDKVYIGSAKDFGKREQDHRRELRAEKHCNKTLQAVFNKYGESSMVFQPIYSIEYYPELHKIEREFFYTYKSFGIPLCNHYPPGQNPRTSQKGEKNGMFGKTNPFKGKHHTEESKNKHKETLLRKGISYKGENNPQYGKTGELATCFGRTGDKHPMFGNKHPEYLREQIAKTSGAPLIYAIKEDIVLSFYSKVLCSAYTGISKHRIINRLRSGKSENNWRFIVG